MAAPLLWDLDGTLIDSAPGILACLRRAYELLAIDEPPEPLLRSMIGTPLTKGFAKDQRLSAEQRQALAQAYKDSWVSHGADGWTAYLGMPELLQRHREAGRIQYLATAKSQLGADRARERIPFLAALDGVVGSQDGEPDKTGVVGRAAARAGADAVMIGDMPSDAEAARANGLRFVAVAWGYGDVDLLAGLGALEVAHSPAELGEILAGL